MTAHEFALLAKLGPEGFRRKAVMRQNRPASCWTECYPYICCRLISKTSCCLADSQSRRAHREEHRQQRGTPQCLPRNLQLGRGCTPDSQKHLGPWGWFICVLNKFTISKKSRLEPAKQALRCELATQAPRLCDSQAPKSCLPLRWDRLYL